MSLTIATLRHRLLQVTAAQWQLTPQPPANPQTRGTPGRTPCAGIPLGAVRFAV